MTTSEMLLKAILDKTTNEETLIKSVQQLNDLSEEVDFWTKIVSDRTYSTTHRRIAIVQFFVRHTFSRKVSELKLDALGLLPSECQVKVMHLITGVVPFPIKAEEAIVRIIFNFGEFDRACVYLSIFPNMEDAELVQVVSGIKANSPSVIADVAVGESLRSGAEIAWERWQQRQIYKVRNHRRANQP